MTAAKRRREERQDQLEAGKLVPVEPIVRFLQAGLLPIRNRLLNLPGESAFLLAGCDQIECFETIDAKVRETLEQISSADFAERAAKAGFAAMQSNRSSHQNGETTDDEANQHKRKRVLTADDIATAGGFRVYENGDIELLSELEAQALRDLCRGPRNLV
jgi:hypothetical protein